MKGELKMENLMKTIAGYMEALLERNDLKEWEYDKLHEIKELCYFILFRKEIELTKEIK